MIPETQYNVQHKGHSWLYLNPPTIETTGTVVGATEGNGPLKGEFDYVCPDLRIKMNSFEKAEQKMQQKACEIAMAKAQISAEDVDLLFAGDLLNQNTSSAFTAREIGIPFFGLFAACSTMCEGLSLASLAVASGAAKRAIAFASSHTCTAERQFRYPNEYGCQKPPQSQMTAAAVGAAIIKEGSGLVKISRVTIGKVCDYGVTDPFNMGAAMAPGFVDTIEQHFRDCNCTPEDYDLILSGDLGRAGQDIAYELMQKRGIEMARSRLQDCGLLLFGDNPAVFSGGSGCGCAASVGMGYIYHQLCRGELNRVLLCATGALISPVASQQKESIPGICHAVVLERSGESV